MRALTGHKSNSSLSLVREDSGYILKHLSTRLSADSVLAKKTGEKLRIIEPSLLNPMLLARAWSSLILCAVAKAIRKSVLIVISFTKEGVGGS